MKNNQPAQKGNRKGSRKIGCFDWQVDELAKIAIHKSPEDRVIVHLRNDHGFVPVPRRTFMKQFLLSR
ncbi:MAG TPA: hypothetical protein VH413_15270 [Verrucomicrobiae bacterium]|jgi:hypothetical protein|nr:hypothetical protein [Verrucomicrobiae bacterium]